MLFIGQIITLLRIILFSSSLFDSIDPETQNPSLSCRAPNPDAVVVVRSPSGVFSGRNLLQKQKGCYRGSRLVTSKIEEQSKSSASETNDFEPYSAARCRAYVRSNDKVVH